MFNKKKYNREYSRQARDNNMPSQTTENINKLRKKAIFAILGDECTFCGFDDVRALQIDHVYGGGSKERKELKNNYNKYYRKVLESVEIGDDYYQLLCANCNWIKRCENKEYRKKEDSESS